jgi:hypothetical protein
VVSSRLYPTRIEVVADDALIASHVRLLDRDQVSYDWQHYIPLIERKPGALRNGAPFADLPAPLRQLSTVWGVMPAVTGSWRKFWLPYRSPDSMPCWWPLSWYWKRQPERRTHPQCRGAADSDRTTTQRRNPLVAQGSPRR